MLSCALRCALAPRVRVITGPRIGGRLYTRMGIFSWMPLPGHNHNGKKKAAHATDMLNEAAAIEKETPGAIHALHFDSGGKNVHCSVVFNRNRVEGGGAQRGRDDYDSSKREGQHGQQQRATKPNAAGQASQSGQRAPPRDQPRQPSGDGRTRDLPTQARVRSRRSSNRRGI